LVAPFIAFIATTTILISLYVGLFYIPYHHLFAVYREAFRQNAQDLWDLRAPIVCLRVLTVPGIWDLRGLPLALLVVAGLSAVSRAAREAPMGAARSWGILMALWLFLGLLYFAPQTYRPSRFTVLFVPPAAALAARGCLWLWSTGKSVRGPGPAAGIAWLIYLAAAALVQLEYPPDRDLGKNQGLLLLLMSVWAATAWGRRREPLRPVIARAAGTLLTGILIVSGLVEYGVWALHPHESLVSSEQTSIRLIAKSPSAGDNWCMAAALMHDSPAYKIDWLPVTEGELRRLGVHYLIVDAQEDRMLELYAPLLKRSTLLCSERIGPYRIHILKTPW
jgi:hypothetical protein